MALDTLEKLGFSPGEARTYRALLFLGRSGVGPLAREAGISHSKIYEVLERLIAKGLVSKVFYGKHTAYQAAEPIILKELVNRREKELSEVKSEVDALIPKLIETRVPEKRTVELFEGFNGLKTVREQLLLNLKAGDEFLVLGAPRLVNELWESWLLDFHKRREKKGIGMRIIYEADARRYGEKRKRFKLTKMRYLPREVTTPTWFDVFKDSVLIVVMHGEKPYCILVRSPQLANSVKSYFNLLWNISIE